MRLPKTNQMKIVPALAMVAVILFAAFAFYAMIGQEWVHAYRRSRTASQIVESYRRSAAIGEVARPATNSDSIQCWSECFWGLPTTVKVKTVNGDEFIFSARQRTNSSVWTFIQVYPPSGHSVTNAGI
jgi:hypothetical protein